MERRTSSACGLLPSNPRPTRDFKPRKNHEIIHVDHAFYFFNIIKKKNVVAVDNLVFPVV